MYDASYCHIACDSLHATQGTHSTTLASEEENELYRKLLISTSRPPKPPKPPPPLEIHQHEWSRVLSGKPAHSELSLPFLTCHELLICIRPIATFEGRTVFKTLARPYLPRVFCLSVSPTHTTHVTFSKTDGMPFSINHISSSHSIASEFQVDKTDQKNSLEPIHPQALAPYRDLGGNFRLERLILDSFSRSHPEKSMVGRAVPRCFGSTPLPFFDSPISEEIIATECGDWEKERR